MDGTNVFLDFDIIRKTNLEILLKEMDMLIVAGKKIFVWSKDFDPYTMQQLCRSTRIPKNEKEVELHKECIRLNNLGMIYRDIAKKLEVPVKRVSYFLRRDPERIWTLDDWIVEYLQKDSSVYQKVDIVVDPEQRVVDRFTKAGVEAHLFKA